MLVGNGGKVLRTSVLVIRVKGKRSGGPGIIIIGINFSSVEVVYMVFTSCSSKGAISIEGGMGEACPWLN